MRLVIVYHDPGDPLGHGMVDALASEVSNKLGIEVETVTISRIESGNYKPPATSAVYALFITRGGHVETVSESAKAAGALFISNIPPRVTAEGLAQVLRGCRSIALVYWPAKRFVSRQMHDLEEIRSMLEQLTGVPVVLRTGCSPCPEDCVAPLSLMPGRLSRRIKEAVGPRARVSHVLPLIHHSIIDNIEESLIGARAGRGRDYVQSSPSL